MSANTRVNALPAVRRLGSARSAPALNPAVGPTYGALASIYDRLMAHVGYQRWHILIEDIVQRYSVTMRPSIFEIGAGTALLGEMLIAAGFPYIASDLSFPMCLKARSRTGRVLCADGMRLPLKNSARFDMVLFLYDGINYLRDKDEYGQVFGEVHAHLNTGGLFLFDVTTVFNSETNFAEYVDSDEFCDCFYFRHSYYHAHKNMQYNDFTIFIRFDRPHATHAVAGDPDANGRDCLIMTPGDGDRELYAKSVEHHEQKVFPVSAVQDFIPHGLFDVLGVWDNFSFKKYFRRSERVHFLLRKKEER
jgi:SAM-dependent methyltransferase